MATGFSGIYDYINVATVMSATVMFWPTAPGAGHLDYPQVVGRGTRTPAPPPCEAPGYCSTACWKVQRHVEPKPRRWHEPWKAPIPDKVRFKNYETGEVVTFAIAAHTHTPQTSRVAQLPPMPIDTSKELAHMRKRWDTSPRYEAPGRWK